jgi:tryptophan synthase beta subunit
VRRSAFITLLGGAAPLPNRLTQCLIAAALMLPMPSAYAETQAARHMITTAAAIALYKMHCRGKISASAVETVNTSIRKYGESRVVASMVEMGLQREKLGDAAFCVHVEKSLPKK